MTSATITEIAAALGISRMAANNRKLKYNWQPVNESGVDTFNINCIHGLYDEECTKVKKYLAQKSLNSEAAASEAAETAAITAKLLKIKEQERLEALTDAEVSMSDEDREELLWQPFAKKNNKQRDKAVLRSKAISAFETRRYEFGLTERDAIEETAKEFEVHPNSVRNWVRKTISTNRADRAAVLVCQNKCNTPLSEFTPEAWTSFKQDFLRRSRPSISSCYRRLQAAAEQNGWIIPIKRTVENWIKRNIDPMVIKYRREGIDAVERCFPAMKRNKEMFDVLQAVNGDGFALGIWADFGNDTIAKPIVWSWQDIRSSKILAWRMDISENRELVRLATLDLITEWGIPELIYLDNTRAATSKQISGGLPNRYRFKVKDDDPLGIMPLLGINLKQTLPGHGQSKPVERVHGIGGYLDFDSLPVFEGRGTKSRPEPIAEVEALFKDFVNEINARQDRRGDAVQGKSFDQVFNELLPLAIVTKATEKQRKYCLCVAEVVTVSNTDASITLKAGKSDIGSNRYWDDALTKYMGQKVTVRFDPTNMHSGVYVETVKGEEICFATPTSTGGFKDADAARKHARDKGHFKKHVKLAAEAEGRMDAATARQYMISSPEPEKPTAAKVTKIAATVPSKGKVAAVTVDQEETADAAPVKSNIELFAEYKNAKLPKSMTHEEAHDAFMKGFSKIFSNKTAG